MKRKGLIFIFGALYIIYSIIMLILSIKNSLNEYIYYNLGMFLGFLILIMLNRRDKIKPTITLGLVILAILHLSGGNILIEGQQLYLHSIFLIPFDKIVHFYGGFLATLICIEIVARFCKINKKNYLAAGILAVLAALGLGSLVEIWEFLATRVIETTIVGDYANNALDLVANTLGSLVWFLFFIIKRQK